MDKYKSDSRTIMLDGDVDDEMLRQLVSDLSYLAAHSVRKPILLFLNSGGGDEDAAVGMISVIEACPAPVYVIAAGYVASAAFDVLCLAPQGRRAAVPLGSIMTHAGYPNPQGGPNRASVDDFLRAYDRQQERVWETLISRHPKAVDVLETARSKKDVWLTGEEAFDLGLVDFLWTAETAAPLYKAIRERKGTRKAKPTECKRSEKDSQESAD